MRKITFILLLCSCMTTIQSFASDTARPPGQQSRRVLVAEMANLIKRHAYFHAGSAVFRYDARIDTVGKIRLFVGEQVNALGGNRTENWYYIDFAESISADDFTVVMGLNDKFFIQSAKTVTKKVGKIKDKGSKLFVRFFANSNKRTTDFEQLHARLFDIVNQLTTL